MSTITLTLARPVEANLAGNKYRYFQAEKTFKDLPEFELPNVDSPPIDQVNLLVNLDADQIFVAFRDHFVIVNETLFFQDLGNPAGEDRGAGRHLVLARTGGVAHDRQKITDKIRHGHGRVLKLPA